MNIRQHSKQRPIVGSIYHDKSGSSLVVLSVAGDKVLLEYANGTITSIDGKYWQELQPKIAVY